MLFLVLLSLIPSLLQPQTPANARRPEDRVSPPLVTHKVDPQYTDEARVAGIQGTVVLQATIGSDGVPHVLRVVRSLGFGLDENAIAAVEQWRFQPAHKPDGTPAETTLNVQVNFNLPPGVNPARPAPPPAPPETGESHAVGTRVAFVRNGNIWIAALPDGIAEQITRNGGVGAPAWSPSGKWIAFTQNGNVTVLSAEPGHPESQSFTGASGPKWSPRTDELALLDPNGLAVVDFKNNPSAKQVVSKAVKSFAWRPDGNSFAVVSQSSLSVIDKTGTALHKVYSMPQGSITLAGWSSDGQYVLFWPNQENSASIQADGLGLMSVAANGGAVREISQTLTYPEWISSSQRESQLLITSGEDREVWTRKRVALVDPASGNNRYLTDSKTAAGAASWSPDGGLIALVVGPDAGSVGGGDEARRALNRRRIWITAPDGSGLRQLTPNSDFRDDHPLWTPDGKSIVFLRQDSEDQMSLWIIGTDGGTPHKISEATKGFGYYGHIDETWFSISPQ